MSSQTPYSVHIDFDNASNAWHQNKKKHSNGTYTYVCGTPLKNGQYCQRTVRNHLKCHHHKQLKSN